MKIYNVEFNGTYKNISMYPDILKMFTEWDRGNYIGHQWKNSRDDEEMKEHILKQKLWDELSLDFIIENHPEKLEIKGDKRRAITVSMYEKCFKICTLINIIDVDTEAQLQVIDLDLLSEKIGNIMLSKTGGNLFNNKLHIHQPNMPLFTYNDFTYVTDFCTEALQKDYINNGFRVVAVCPQPDQRRPDYILGRYIKSDKED